MRVAHTVLALVLPIFALPSCGEAFTSTGDPGGGAAGQNAAGDSAPQGPTDAATSDRGAPLDESGPSVNPDATIACSNEQCEPGPEKCCMQNSQDLPDFCFGGTGQPDKCASAQVTVTELECDDGEDCARAKHPGTVCCAQARTFDISPDLPVWAVIHCVAPSNCLKATDDVFCGSNPADCPAGKTCTKMLGPYTYCE